MTYTDHTADNAIIDTWTTNDKGEVTLPMTLDEGSYTIREVTAPGGYVLNDEALAFDVDEYRTWDNPLVLTFTDTPIKGSIEITKADSTTAALVAGADYTIKAATDIVTGDGTIRNNAGDTVGTVTTDENGYAKVEGLYLGEYIVYETKAPDGYALDPVEHTVIIESQGQTVPVVRMVQASKGNEHPDHLEGAQSRR